MGRQKDKTNQCGGWRAGVALAVTAVLLAGCAGKQGGKPAKSNEPVACVPAAAGDAWVGNWLGSDKLPGVAGQVQVQTILHADGTMAWTEQLKRKGKPPQVLNETGCWSREGGQLLLRTTHSNGVAVEQDDPIYTNRYPVRPKAGYLTLEKDSRVLSLKRMPDGYKLPVF